MDIRIDPRLLKLVTSVDDNIEKVVREALNLWIEKNVPICPINKEYCVYPGSSCNECELADSEARKNVSDLGTRLK